MDILGFVLRAIRPCTDRVTEPSPNKKHHSVKICKTDKVKQQEKHKRLQKVSRHGKFTIYLCASEIINRHNIRMLKTQNDE